MGRNQLTRMALRTVGGVLRRAEKKGGAAAIPLDERQYAVAVLAAALGVPIYGEQLDAALRHLKKDVEALTKTAETSRLHADAILAETAETAKKAGIRTPLLPMPDPFAQGPR